MKIKLRFLLNKKRIKLNAFCELNNLHSYQALLKYCDDKKLICVQKDEYEKECNLKPQKVKTNGKPKAQQKEVPLKTRRRGRKPKTKKAGTADKKSDS